MNNPVGGVVMGLAVGSLFTAGIINSVRTGTIKLRSGASLDRKYQRGMFWRVIAGLSCAAALSFFWAARSLLHL